MATPQASGGDQSSEYLLVQAGQGSQRAFAQLYPRIAGPVYSLALRVVRDPVQAEDITQNTLVAVWRSASSYDPGSGEVLAWVLTLAHRRAVDWVRAEQAHRDRERRAARGAYRRAADTTVDAILRSQDHARVREWLRSLTPAQQQLIALVYFEGLTMVRTASVLEIPVGTVKSRLRAVLGQLRSSMIEH